MESNNNTNTLHIGRKIERIRRLRGMTQSDLGDALKITKQAVSKMEQTENVDDDRLKEIAAALGVTSEGLKSYNEETVLYNTINFYENCGVTTSAVSNNHTFNNFPIEKAVEIFEKLLDKEREKLEILKKERKQE